MIPLTLAVLLMTYSPPQLELDHVYIVVSPGGQAEIAALRAAGLTVSTRTQKHDGQGTASVAAFFGNAYLELLWVDSSVSVDEAHQSSYAWFRAAQDWRKSGTIPFGIGLRRMAGDTTPVGVPVIREPASWLPADQAYELLRLPSETHAADVFIVPPVGAVPVWVARRREMAPQLFVHAAPANEITAIRVHGTRAQQPSALGVLKPARVEAVVGDAPLLEVIFDGGKQGKRTDLRPLLPLVLMH
ncbi:MAG TPA: VOC family protein [Longimicrobiales bacterium]